MALVLGNRVLETTETTGTGTVTLAGAVSGFQTFANGGLTNADTTYYCITSGVAWEVGLGTYASVGPTLARTTILASSSGGAAITLAGTSNVFCVYPSSKSVYLDASGNVAGYNLTTGTINSTTVGATTPATGAFTTLTATGAVVFGTGDGTASVTGNTVRSASSAGTNLTGASLTLSAGNGTGTGGSGALIFTTAPAGATGATANTLAEVARVTADKYLRMAASTNGIQFNGDAAAVNALDDYEEGSWTVNFYDAASAGNTSATTAAGYYTKIGDLIIASFAAGNISTVGLTAANAFYFSLPIAANGGSKGAGRGTADIDTITLPASRTYAVVLVATGATRGSLVACGSALTNSSVLVSGISTGVADFYITVAYRA
jgi:hypothetical protein